jgi:hypothetical protein
MSLLGCFQVRQLERKEEMKAYPPDDERFVKPATRGTSFLEQQATRRTICQSSVFLRAPERGPFGTGTFVPVTPEGLPLGTGFLLSTAAKSLLVACL